MALLRASMDHAAMMGLCVLHAAPHNPTGAFDIKVWVIHAIRIHMNPEDSHRQRMCTPLDPPTRELQLSKPARRRGHIVRRGQ